MRVLFVCFVSMIAMVPVARAGAITAYGTYGPSQFRKVLAAFERAVPGVHVRYMKLGTTPRLIKPITAYRTTGDAHVDVIFAVGPAILEAWKDAAPLADLRTMPNWKHIAAADKDPLGRWVGTSRQYYCLAYNTRRVDPKMLPARWVDLPAAIEANHWNLGLSERMGTWALPLWSALGPAHFKKLMLDLRDTGDAQLRHGRMGLLARLVTAGEIDLAMPAKQHHVLSQPGAPIAWYCPAPISAPIARAVVLNGGHTRDALTFMNWMLSADGQAAQARYASFMPVRRDMAPQHFLPLFAEMAGKPLAPLEVGYSREMNEFWKGLVRDWGRQ